MRRWGRILFNTLTAISLLLALATAGLSSIVIRKMMPEPSIIQVISTDARY